MIKSWNLWLQNKTPDAIECLQPILKHEAYPSALLLQAIMHCHSRDFAAAKKDLDSLVQIEGVGDTPKYILTRLLLDWGGTEVRDTVRAAHLAKELFEKGDSSNKSHYHMILARCYEASKQPQLAKDLRDSEEYDAEAIRATLEINLGFLEFNSQPLGPTTIVPRASEESLEYFDLLDSFPQ